MICPVLSIVLLVAAWRLTCSRRRRRIVRTVPRGSARETSLNHMLGAKSRRITVAGGFPPSRCTISTVRHPALA